MDALVGSVAKQRLDDGHDILTIGEMCLDLVSREAKGPGGVARVEPLVAQVLEELVLAKGAVVTRARLFDRCWGNVVVGDDSLNRVIKEIRRLANTVGGDSFAIETIPKSGYRLSIAAAMADHAADPVPTSATTVSNRRAAFLGLAAIGVSGAALWYGFRQRGDPRVAALIDQALVMDGGGLPDSEMRGEALLEEAVGIDPTSARAWGLLALVRTAMTEFAPTDRVASVAQSAREAAQRALEIDPNQADAAAALAILRPSFGDWLNCERGMEAVLRDHPKHLPTRDALNFLRVGTGQCRLGSLDRIDMVAENPLHVGYQCRLIYAYWMLGDIGAADRTAERARTLWPRHAALWLAHLWLLTFTKRADRALAEVENIETRPDLPPWLVELTRTTLAAILSGRPADRERSVRLIMQGIARAPTGSITGILMLNGLGETDRAFDVATAYLLERGPLFAEVQWSVGGISLNDTRRRKTHMLFIPASAAMRADPRFMPLVTDIGLAAYWDRARVVPDFLQRGPGKTVAEGE